MEHTLKFSSVAHADSSIKFYPMIFCGVNTQSLITKLTVYFTNDIMKQNKKY